MRVMAVCVEEDSDGRGLTIRVASNAGELSDTRLGLQGITNILEEASVRSMSSPFHILELGGSKGQLSHVNQWYKLSFDKSYSMTNPGS